MGGQLLRFREHFITEGMVRCEPTINTIKNVYEPLLWPFFVQFNKHTILAATANNWSDQKSEPFYKN